MPQRHAGRLLDQALVAGGFLLVANGDCPAPGKPPRRAPRPDVRPDSAFVRVVRLLLADAPDVRGAVPLFGDLPRRLEAV